MGIRMQLMRPSALRAGRTPVIGDTIRVEPRDGKHTIIHISDSRVLARPTDAEALRRILRVLPHDMEKELNFDDGVSPHYDHR